jgi:beta-glucosidase
MSRNLSPDERAELVLKKLTLDEKIAFIHGNGMPGWGEPRPNADLGNGGAGFVLGSCDMQSACNCGPLIGRELRAQGYNMTLGGGVNLSTKT